jgi:hypothetical protein
VDNYGDAGDSAGSHPQVDPGPEISSAEGGLHPHRHGDAFPFTHQHGMSVIHNPQPLLPLLNTLLSTSLVSDWGHGRKDKLR